MKYSERRTETVRNRILLTEQRLKKRYSPTEAGANGSAPAADIRTTPNGSGVPAPNGSVAAEQSLRVVRAFACDDGAPIHLQYDGQAFREPGGTSLGGQSRAASSTPQALSHRFEAFGDAADPACASSPQAGVQPTMPADNKALQGQNGGMVPASNQVPSRDTTPSSSGNLTSVPVNTTPPAQTPSFQHIASPNTPAENAPQSAAANWNAPARVAPQSLPPDNEDTFAADLQALLSEARRRVNTGQEMPALSSAPAGQAVVPPAATPPAAPQPPAPTAASPAAQAQTAGADTADRYALFNQLGQQMQRAVTFDMGTVPVDKTFAAIEAAIDAQEAHTARRAQGKRKPVQAKPLSPIEVVEDLALSTAPREMTRTSAAVAQGEGGGGITTQQTTFTHPLIPQIFEHIESSGLVKYNWRDRGPAPIGYLKGMALTYARVYCKYTTPERMPASPSPEGEILRNYFTVQMAKGVAPGANPVTDAIAKYANTFKQFGADVSVDGVAVLRSLFTILFGLGMRESGGKHCKGWDRGKKEAPTATNSEAGLFQMSYDIGVGVPGDFKALYEQYKQRPDSGFLQFFSEGVACSADDAENFGAGVGREFQQFSKDCPAFTVELAALALRTRANHWGPINRDKVELLRECWSLLLGVETAIDDLGGCVALL